MYYAATLTSLSGPSAILTLYEFDSASNRKNWLRDCMEDETPCIKITKNVFEISKPYHHAYHIHVKQNPISNLCMSVWEWYYEPI